MKVRIIMPCYNEKETFLQTYSRLSEVLAQDSQTQNYEYDLLFVDDGSHDETIALIQKEAAMDEHVKF
ncbi:glycosyltransferase, partial [Staphylococcus massiliensis]